MNRLTAAVSLIAAVALAACGGDALDPNATPPPGQNPTPPPNTSSVCSSPQDIVLAPGAHAIVDPSGSNGCLRLPAAGVGGAEHLYVAVAANGRETSSGVTQSYELRGSPAVSGGSNPIANRPPSAIDPTLNAFEGRASNSVFHALLRNRERILAAQPGAVSFAVSAHIAANRVAIPPVLGSKRTFKVCATESCASFVDVEATARYVGARNAIYLDDTVPAGGYSQAELDDVGFLFDEYLYPIDTTSFGRESDLDGNDVVVVLLTDQVNALSGGCNASGSVILGYFYGNDLIPGNSGSNAGEVFYGLVPDPNNTSCTISRSFASNYLAPTFVHEFQHMISFNQHVLERGGFSEDTWLNEGLSHYAEELAGRSIPDQYCGGDCLSQFAVGDIYNAYAYLADPEAHFLVEPGSSSGSLEERGANWLFVRWLVDHFGADLTGAAFTRSLVETNRLGMANVEAVTGTPFTTLVPEWQLANYVEDLPGFTPQQPRLRYSSWNLRATFEALHDQAPGSFPRAYPLVPDSTAGVYARVGTLRGGSGRHVRIVQAPNGASVTFHLTDAERRAIGGSAATPRIAIVRVR